LEVVLEAVEEEEHPRQPVRSMVRKIHKQPPAKRSRARNEEGEEGKAAAAAAAAVAAAVVAAAPAPI